MCVWVREKEFKGTHSRKHNGEEKINRVENKPGVGVKWPLVEFGLEFIIRCCCGWFSTLMFEVALCIVVIDRLAELWVWAMWWSRGGDTGSDFTLMAIGDVLGGGVLFDTAKCDMLQDSRTQTIKKKTEINWVNVFFLPHSQKEQATSLWRDSIYVFDFTK